jgi:hypothetical protein
VAATRKQLREFAATVTGVDGGTEAVLGEGTPHNILREAGQRAADLIVVGVHGRSAIGSFRLDHRTSSSPGDVPDSQYLRTLESEARMNRRPVARFHRQTAQAG